MEKSESKFSHLVTVRVEVLFYALPSTIQLKYIV